ncbi:MAG: hypothetical protein AAF773_24015 [Cyanobacteria bacterium P01_D01_bin.115]
MSSNLSRRQQRRQQRAGFQPVDRAAIALAVVLTVVIAVLLMVGGRAAARVRDFSWDNHQIGAEDAAFLLTFSRPMDHASVENNLKIEPPLPGKMSWAGRLMAYTLDAPAPYGELYEVSLPTARDRYSSDSRKPANFASFRGQFQSRDRAFVYLGVSGEEQGRLVLFNLSRQEKTVLTPPNLVVLDFKPYPLGDRVLFSGIDAEAYERGDLDQKLYSVTTGIAPNPPPDLSVQGDRSRPDRAEKPQEAGIVELVLDSETYQNFKFDLSRDGDVIVVQRVNADDPSDFGPWLIYNGQTKPLNTEPGGDFAIAPDSRTLVMLQGEGTAIIPLPLAENDLIENDIESAELSEPLDFLPEFGRVLDISPDGNTAALINYNQNNPDQRYTETLTLVDNQGEEKALLTATGKIWSAQFDTTGRSLYVLSTELLDSETYVEQPVLSAINLSEDVLKDLLLFPPQPNINMSLSPDGLALLFDRAVSSEGVDPSAANGATSEIWLVPLYKTPTERISGLPSSDIEPQSLPFAGVQPIWLP